MSTIPLCQVGSDHIVGFSLEAYRLYPVYAGYSLGTLGLSQTYQYKFRRRLFKVTKVKNSATDIYLPPHLVSSLSLKQTLSI